MKETPKTNRPDIQFHMVFQEPGEKEAEAKKYGIIGKETIDRMEKRQDGWYLDGVTLSEYKKTLDDLYQKDPEPWKN